MITCPNCRHEEMAGALFCSNCGAQLLKVHDHGTMENYEIRGKPSSGSQSNASDTISEDHSTIFLQVLANGGMLSLTGREEYTLGRVHEGQSIVPDIDLNPYGGYEGGVSRLHATIQAGEKTVKVIDLGSINGTVINDKKIPRYVPHTLTHGDVLTLGKMKMKVIIRK